MFQSRVTVALSDLRGARVAS